MTRKKSNSKRRLDVAAHERGLFDSREKARRAIMAGLVRVGEVVADKPGHSVAGDADISVVATCPFVGRGGLKLEGALDAFGIDPTGRVCLDIGASTGGFTDCLLQRGAARVYAFDVGHGQLAWKIRSDPRVVVREKFNARHLGPDDLPEQPSLVVIDVSFISLTLILPGAFSVLAPGGQIVALVKPQFELRREQVGKGGLVSNEDLRQTAVEKIRGFVAGTLGCSWLGVVASPVVGASGNQEYLACLAP